MGASMTMTTPDVFDSPLYPVVIRLEGQGFQFRLLPDGTVQVNPGAKLPPDARALFQQHPDDLRVLVAMATDAGVHDRRDVFRLQYAAAPTGTLPTFLFTTGVAYVRGACFSCGDVLPGLTFARCWRCAIAWRLACRLAVPVWVAEARNGAKVLA